MRVFWGFPRLPISMNSNLHKGFKIHLDKVRISMYFCVRIECEHMWNGDSINLLSIVLDADSHGNSNGPIIIIIGKPFTVWTVYIEKRPHLNLGPDCEHSKKKWTKKGKQHVCTNDSHWFPILKQMY